MINKDTSPYAPQRDKLGKYKLIFRDKIPWTPKQKEFFSIALNKETKIVFVKGPAGTSKAQPLDADIVTPMGFVKMGDIQVGDLVSASDGSAAQVLSLHPQGIKDIYKVSFSDGTSTECTEDHLWLTQTSAERRWRKKKNNKRFKSPKAGSVKTTKEIQETLFVEGDKRKNHSIPITKEIHFEKSNDLPIPPYILGMLLGDGCMRYGTSFTSADKEIVEKVRSLLPTNMAITQKIGSEIEYRIVDDKANWTRPNAFTSGLKTLGLFGLYSHEKFIPYIYKFTSINNRIELLRGLMDTDGGAEKMSTMFYTSSKRLAEDVRFLVESLGGVCFTNTHPAFYTYKEERKQGKDSIRVCVVMPPHINPFSLPRKANKVIPKTKYTPQRYIIGVELVGKKECQCILIDHPSHLYLTNNFIVTHNTLISVCASLKMLAENRISDIIYLRSAVESADSKLGFLPGDVDEKLHFYNLPFMDKLEELLTKEGVSYLEKDNRISMFPINYARGLSWNAKAIVIDEAQNSSRKELITVLTRLGKYSKCFVLADPKQSDLPYNKRGGFEEIMSLFTDETSKENGIFTFEFGKEDIVRDELVKFMVDRFESLPQTN